MDLRWTVDEFWQRNLCYSWFLSVDPLCVVALAISECRSDVSDARSVLCDARELDASCHELASLAAPGLPVRRTTQAGWTGPMEVRKVKIVSRSHSFEPSFSIG